MNREQEQIEATLVDLIGRCKEWGNKDTHATVGELYAVVLLLAGLMSRINRVASE